MSEINLLPKQSVAYKYLLDNTTKEVLYGGSVGSAKTTLGCIWAISMCLKYKGTRYLIGRSKYTQLRLTTMKTLIDVLNWMELKPDLHYNLNNQTNVLTFINNSEIVFKDLAYYPSDSEYDSLGSLEITGAFLDEASQIDFKAYNIIKTRIRYKLNEYKLIPKLLMTCNPSQGWLKKEFYNPSIDGTLEPVKQFVRALPTDNPYLPESYIETLRALPSEQYKRLYLGDWDYSDDINNLFQYDNIINSMFSLDINQSNEKYLSVDVGRFGTDLSVIVAWVGNTIVDIQSYQKNSIPQLATEVESYIKSFGVKRTNVIVDDSGVGGGLTDLLKCKGFVSNERPLNGENYINLKAQCYVKLSEQLKIGNISININNPTLIDKLIEELLVIKLKDVDKDGKVTTNTKDEQKRILGHSPDYADAIMMKMFFDIPLKNKATGRYSLSILG
jgi:PBSX family phage terminase large subunit